ncbi:MAG: ferric reductase-like transmembrane domain-containing protein [Elusimicrobia bacterium]|nr:ferric reductase-like transmembrane domain-containing protein [Elusimicrobiota bacterium]
MLARRSPGDALLAAACLAPTAFGLAFGGAFTGLELLGRAAGALGLSCLLLAALTSARIPGVDVRFGGLTRVWKIHHVLGAAAFLLLLAHPLLLAFAAAPASLRAAAAVLLPEAAARGAWAGWLALAAMAAFLAPSFWFFGRPEYRRWKALHALSGLAVVAGTAHAAASGGLLPGRRGQALWALYGSAALLAFIWRAFASRLWGRKGYVVARVEAVGRGIVELTLRPEGELLAHRAGQFIYLTALAPELSAGRGEEHPYTVSSAPGEPALRVAIKDMGDASRALQTVSVGSRALVEGPYGGFFPAGAPGARELWIAGGVGLAPFLSRVRAMAAGEPVDVDLIYCVQDETRAHFRAELESVAARVAGLRLWPHYFGREGSLDAAFFASRCPDFAGRDIFICGPPGLIAAARGALRRAGVRAARIRSEEFDWL